jgi:hypothetical protein
MKKILFLIIIIAIAALFLVPESLIGDYKGLIKVKYALRDTAVKIKNIAIDFARTGEKPAELEGLEQSAKEKLKEGAKDTLKEAATETIEGL